MALVPTRFARSVSRRFRRDFDVILFRNTMRASLVLWERRKSRPVSPTRRHIGRMFSEVATLDGHPDHPGGGAPDMGLIALMVQDRDQNESIDAIRRRAARQDRSLLEEQERRQHVAIDYGRYLMRRYGQRKMGEVVGSGIASGRLPFYDGPGVEEIEETLRREA